MFWEGGKPPVHVPQTKIGNWEYSYQVMRTRGFKAATAAILMLVWTQAAMPGDFPDCNDNGVDDTVETVTTFTEMQAADERFPSLLADIDSDGDLDVVGSYDPGSPPAVPLSWRENLDGLGTFGPAQLIDDVEGEVVVGDFDRDGDPDLAFRARGEYCASPLYIAVYENLGFGTFAPPQVVWDIVSCGGCPSGWYGDRSWGVADRDSDGDLDIFALVGVCSAGKVLTVLNDGTGNRCLS